MRIFQSLSLIVALAVCYLLFFRSQSMLQPPAKNDGEAVLAPETQTGASSIKPRTQYKADIEQAQKVASQMKAARQEPDSF